MSLPNALRQRVDRFLTGSGDDPADIADALVAWLDGRHPDDLDAALDLLRERGAYPISLELLEHAWNADLPLDRLGRVAEDWLGTVLHGLGDRAGAEVVARHLTPRAIELGAPLAGDLGHVLLGWGLWEVAAPLVRFAAAEMPGDLSYQFNLGVVHKLAGDFAASRGAFELVLLHRPDDRAARWNLGIACTALEDWPAARAAWEALGFRLPPGEGDFGAPAEPTPLRLPTAPGAPVASEVVWGRRMDPARAMVTTVPRYPGLAEYGDVVLIDGVPAGETRLEGQKLPIFPALRVTRRYGGHTVELHGPADPALYPRARALAEALNRAGWPTGDWSELAGARGIHLAVVIPPGRSAAEARAVVERHAGDLPIDLSPLQELSGA